MSQSIVTTRGRINIPAEIRKGLGLETQDQVVFTTLRDGTVVIRAKPRSVMELKKLLKQPKSAGNVSVEDMLIGRD